MNDADTLLCRDKIAVVTGASSGIGRAVALELASRGAHVAVHTRAHRADAERVAQSITSMGRQALVLEADVSRPADRQHLVASAWSWQGGVDIWVNNAGADVLTGEARGWTFEQKLERLWQVDVCGTIALSREIGRRMRDASVTPGSHCILNMGWDQAETGMEGESGEMFAAAKGAVMAFSRSLARSLAPQVRVCCLAPGWIRTSWGESASEAWQERARGESLLERWGTPEDVARVAAFLASPAASFVNGQIVPVNGGLRTGCPFPDHRPHRRTTHATDG